MTDPLSLLRQYNINKKEIVERDGQIVFGEFSWPKSVETNYIEWPSGKNGSPKVYYTLECLHFILKNQSLVHPVYVRHATKENIPIVRRSDRKDLLAYLNGETETCSAIDESAPVEIPTCIKSSTDYDTSESWAKKPRLQNMHVQKVWEKLAKRLNASKEASVAVDNIKSLSEVISAKKVAAIKAKRLSRKRSAVKDDDVGPILDSNVDVT